MAPQTAELVKEISPYLDTLNKVHEPFDSNELCKSWVAEWLARNGFDKKANNVDRCGLNAVSLKCAKGHQKINTIHCHKEYCPKCGQIDSILHKQRKARVAGRLLHSAVLGYTVFTLPQELSDSYPSRAQLSKLEQAAAKIVKDNFDTPGVFVRSHEMGDEPGKLNFHVNVIFEILNTNFIGRIGPDVLDLIRRQWTERVNQIFDSNFETVVVHYSFATSLRKKRHIIKYVTRPIVTAEKFLSLSNQAKLWILNLSGWHNSRWFGVYANANYKEYLKTKGVDPYQYFERNPFLSKYCPVDGSRFKRCEIIDREDIPRNQGVQVTKDTWVDFEIYYAVKNKPPPT